MYESIRLRKNEIETIIKIFKQYFGNEDHLWIFGSRVDLKKRGGDIDLYVESSRSQDELNEKKIKFLVALKNEIGEQKIDLVMRSLSSKNNLSIYDEAKQTGVKLV